MPSFFLCPVVFADTVTLKNGKDLKGLVVEKHADRIILSTEKKEIPILLKGIKGQERYLEMYEYIAKDFKTLGQVKESAHFEETYRKFKKKGMPSISELDKFDLIPF